MIKVRKSKKQEKKEPEFHCTDCAFSEWDKTFINLDLNGVPFMLRCSFSKWKKFQNDITCDRFVQKTEEQMNKFIEDRKPIKKKKETLNDFLNSLYES
jgi:hypothetical protein